VFFRVTRLLLSEGLGPQIDGDHYRVMAGRLRELARETCSPGIRRELTDLAKRYDRRGDYFDGGARNQAAPSPN
jgi:hypothetical protein